MPPSPPVYFALTSENLPSSLEGRDLYTMAFSILITLLEKYGSGPFTQMTDSLYIGFSLRGPLVAELPVMQKEQNLVGYAKLSEISAVMKLKERVIYFDDVITAENTEMVLQPEFMQAAEEITSRILSKRVQRG